MEPTGVEASAFDTPAFVARSAADYGAFVIEQFRPTP
jgi:hypothetical protein